MFSGALEEGICINVCKVKKNQAVLEARIRKVIYIQGVI